MPAPLQIQKLFADGQQAMENRDFAAAIDVYQRAVDQFEAESDIVHLGNALYQLTEAHRSAHSDLKIILPLLERALSVKKDLEEIDAVIKLSARVSSIYWDQGRFNETIDVCKSALALFPDDAQSEDIAETLSLLGITYYRLGDLESALDYMNRSVEMRRDTHFAHDIASDYHNLANIHSDLGRHDKAHELYSLALEINKTAGNRRWQATNYNGLGSNLMGRGEYDAALEHFEHVKQLAEELQEPSTFTMSLLNIANCLEQMKRYDEAEANYQHALEEATTIDASMIAATIRGALGTLYSRRDWNGFDAQKAESYLQQALSEITEVDARMQQYDIHNSLSYLYEGQNRWEDALNHYKQYITIRDEVRNEEVHLRAEQIERQRQEAEREKEIAIAKATATARQQATTSLLHKILPESIAERLVGGERIADHFESVSILFCDIVGFTPIASRMNAADVLGFLNHIFSQFDAIVDEHNAEKIKTMGDGYMAMAGAPMPCDDHAERMLRVAMSMMTSLDLPPSIKYTLPSDAHFTIRIGLHTGSCFAGIVGEKRFVYDIYSDAVNIAARMESHGAPGRITISEAFYQHLQQRADKTNTALNNIAFEERDVIEIKGKGKMKTYFISRQ